MGLWQESGAMQRRKFLGEAAKAPEIIARIISALFWNKVVLKEERVAYRFWMPNSGLIALGYNRLQFQNQSDLEVKSESNAIVR